MSFVYGLLFCLALTPTTISPDQLRFAELHKQANAGDPRAQLWVGVAYQRGIGVKRDEGTAVAWFLRSASAGNPDAQNSLGQSYEEGSGIHRDYAQAARWYHAACENRPDYGGAGQGCNNLGLLYFYGRGVPKDYALAYIYAREARNQEQAELSATHLPAAARRRAERRYKSWLRLHAEKEIM
jgi:TPR repeat protein